VTICCRVPVQTARDRLLPDDKLKVKGNAICCEVSAGGLRLIELRKCLGSHFANKWDYPAKGRKTLDCLGGTNKMTVSRRSNWERARPGQQDRTTVARATMSAEVRRSDKKGRVVLPVDFAASVLIIERISDTELRIRKGRTVRKRKYTLDQLLAGVTEENKHPAVDWGPPVGKEILPPYSEKGSYVPQRGDLVWIDFDPQTGHEQRGRRPAVVLSPSSYNRKVELGIFCPVTSQAKGYAWEVVIPADFGVTGVILANQIKSLDWKQRRVQFAGTLPQEVLDEVLDKTLAVIDPEDETK
jgi:mRNA interferase MazF